MLSKVFLIFLFISMHLNSDENFLGNIQGKANVSNAWIMTNNGLITKTNNDGSFNFEKLSEGKYAIKAITAGKQEKVIPNVAVEQGKVTTADIEFDSEESNNSIIYGKVVDDVTGKPIYASMEIQNAGKQIRWFDINAKPYGGNVEIPKNAYHFPITKYFTNGTFAILVRPGTTKITANCGLEYYTSETTTKIGVKEEKEIVIKLKRKVDMNVLGWYCGDFHAHCVHGENYYKVNVPFASFIIKSEGFNWFYLAWDYSNDGLNVDNKRIANEQSNSDFFLRLNIEYPKTRLGHVGAFGGDLYITGKWDEIKKIPGIGEPRGFANIELMNKYVKSGGVSIPVHPVYAVERKEENKTWYHMQYNELPFDMVAGAELIKALDVFYWYGPKETKNLKLWEMFLNKGYRLCATSTSDSAIDTGRTPGDDAKATYIYLGKEELNEKNIINAFNNGRTIFSKNGAFIIFKIDDKVSGSIFSADGKTRKAEVEVYGDVNKIEIIRNGMVFKEFNVKNNGEKFEFDVQEKEGAWYLARCINTNNLWMFGCTSPIYFESKTFFPPKNTIAKVKGKIYDVNTLQPLDATIKITEVKDVVNTIKVSTGNFQIELLPFRRIRVEADGYLPLEKSIALDYEPIKNIICWLAPEELQKWETYEKVKTLLETVTLDFPLKKIR